MIAGRLLLIACVLAGARQAALAQRATGITPDLLGDLERSCVVDAQFRAVQNALSQTDVKKAAASLDVANSVDGYFSHRLMDQKITDQKSSGRCWMFSALNTLRPVAARTLHTPDIELSQNYLFFYDKLEKANLFLEAVIALRDTPFTNRTMEFLLRQPVQDGGNWLGFIELVKKYGVVPREVMPETYGSSHSGGVNHALALELRHYALLLRSADSTGWAPLKAEALRGVYRILALNFGIPPHRFAWRYERTDKTLSEEHTYTPGEFYRDVVHEALDDYVALYAIPVLTPGRHYAIALDRAVADRPDMHFVNVPLETLKSLAVKSLLDDQPVWFGCDVGQETDSETGLMAPGIVDYGSLYGMDLSFTRKELFETYSSVPNHNMVFTGIDIRDGKPVKWLVENSWSEKAGKKGYFTMTDRWFDLYVQVIVVNRKYVPAEILGLYAAPPEMLPPWDPMFRALGLE